MPTLMPSSWFDMHHTDLPQPVEPLHDMLLQIVGS